MHDSTSLWAVFVYTHCTKSYIVNPKISSDMIIFYYSFFRFLMIFFTVLQPTYMHVYTAYCGGTYVYV